MASRTASTPSPLAPETMKAGRPDSASARPPAPPPIRRRSCRPCSGRPARPSRRGRRHRLPARRGRCGRRWRRPHHWRRPDGSESGCARHGRGSGRRCPAPSAAPSIRPGMSARTKSTALVADHAELRMEGGEGIIADLGLGVGDGVEEGGLARIGQADEAGIGDQLQAQPDPHLLAGPAGAVLARRAVGRGLVAGIAAAAVAAAQQDDALPGLGEVGEDMLARRRPAPGCRPGP